MCVCARLLLTGAGECCAKCVATPTCEAGVLDVAGQCYLKAGLTGTTSCANCTSCTLPAQGAASLLFGPPGFRLELNPATLGLQNISVSSIDGAFTQGFVMNDMVPPRRTEFSLWRLNITDCKSTLPEGTRITPCIGGACANTSHTLSADGQALTLLWEGVPLPASFGSTRLNVGVTITQLPHDRRGVSLSGTVGLSPGSTEKVCLQSMVLPTLDGIPMRSNETDAMFVPDFFGHAGKVFNKTQDSLCLSLSLSVSLSVRHFPPFTGHFLIVNRCVVVR
jgi:hypothetical protein